MRISFVGESSFKLNNIDQIENECECNKIVLFFLIPRYFLYRAKRQIWLTWLLAKRLKLAYREMQEQMLSVIVRS